MGCQGYVGYTFLHLFLATLSSVSAAQLNLVKRTGIDTSDLLTVIALLAMCIFLLVLMYYMRPGPLKYIAFVVFIVVMSTLLRKIVERYNGNNILINVLMNLTSVYLAITLAAAWNPGFWGFLLAGMIGLFLSQLGYTAAVIIGAPGKADGINYWISLFGTGIFTVYVAYDTKRVKEDALKCKGNPDYINGALGLYLNILGRFLPPAKR
jgi:hypothetical protein